MGLATKVRDPPRNKERKGMLDKTTWASGQHCRDGFYEGRNKEREGQAELDQNQVRARTRH